MLRSTYFENSLMINGDFNYLCTLQNFQLSALSLLFLKLNSACDNSNIHLFPLGLSQKMSSEDASSSAYSLISKFELMNAELDRVLEEDSPEVSLHV
jgi:hypothetical protein